MPDDDSGPTQIRQINAQLRYYYKGLDPDTLTDYQWASLWQDLVWIRKGEARRQEP